MKNIFLSIATVFVFQIGMAQEVLTIEKAIALTLENNYDIKISKNSEQIAKNNSGILNSGYLPTVNANAAGNYSIRNNNVTLNDGKQFEIKDVNSVSYSTSIALNYLIFDGLGRWYNVKKFKEQHQLSQLQTKFVIENTLLQVHQKYYTVVQQYQSIENLGKSLNISKDRLQRAQFGFEYGQNTKLEILNAKVDFNNDSINIMNAMLSLDNAKRDLNQLMGAAIDYNYIAQTNIEFDVSLNLENLLDKANKNNTTLNQFEKNILINKFNLKIANSNWLPKININGSYNFNNNNNDANSGFNSPLATNYNNSFGPSAQLSLTWNLFDGGKTATNIQNTKLNIEKNHLELESQKLKLEQELKVVWYNYKNALQSIEIQKINLETNKVNFLRSQERFKQGQINSLNFRQAQLNLLNAENSLNISKYNAKALEIRLLSVSGTLSY